MPYLCELFWSHLVSESEVLLWHFEPCSWKCWSWSSSWNVYLPAGFPLGCRPCSYQQRGTLTPLAYKLRPNSHDFWSLFPPFQQLPKRIHLPVYHIFVSGLQGLNLQGPVTWLVMKTGQLRLPCSLHWPLQGTSWKYLAYCFIQSYFRQPKWWVIHEFLWVNIA